MNKCAYFAAALSARVAACLFAVAICCAAASAEPDRVVSFSADRTGVRITLSSGALRIEPCGDKTFHVVYSRGLLPSPPRPGFAVETQPGPGRFRVSGKGGCVTIRTGACGVEVDRATGALRFVDAAGRAFLSETADNARALLPATVAGMSTNTVEQRFVLAPAEALYGLGQHPTGVMNYVGHSVHLQQKNTDVAIPVLVSSLGYGLFWNNPAITDFTASRHSDPSPAVDWRSQCGDSIDYYVFYGPTLDEVIDGYRKLTGSTPMMGRWVWGLWQSKERYSRQSELLAVAGEYRKRQWPLDGVVQDWHYWSPQPWGSHAFNPANYPDPKAMMAQLHAQNVHAIISVWAKFETGSANHDELAKAGVLMVPPASSTQNFDYYDPFTPAGRHLYWDEIAREIADKDFDGWWLDASEPELAAKWGEFAGYRTAAGPAPLVFNAYPLMHTTSVYQGQRAARSDRRVMILTRSAYAGQQRNAAITWSGDIQGTWPVFARQIPDGINFSMSGVPYWNTDTGGFYGGNPADPAYAELFTRWFQFSAFCPMFRVHGAGPAKELWRWDDATQAILVSFDRLRYRLLPYIYSDSWQVSRFNGTMMRGLAMDFQADPHVFDIPDEYLFGPSILVAPVTSAGATWRSVYLPAGASWIDFWTGQTLEGGASVDVPAPAATLPLFVRAGSIVPLGPNVQSAEDPCDPTELRVYPGADGAFTLYDDSGDGYGYEKGEFAAIRLTWNDAAHTLTVGRRDGSYPGMPRKRTFRLVVVKPGRGAGAEEPKDASTLIYSGKAVSVQLPASE